MTDISKNAVEGIADALKRYGGDPFLRVHGSRMLRALLARVEELEQEVYDNTNDRIAFGRQKYIRGLEAAKSEIAKRIEEGHFNRSMSWCELRIQSLIEEAQK